MPFVLALGALAGLFFATRPKIAQAGPPSSPVPGTVWNYVDAHGNPAAATWNGNVWVQQAVPATRGC